MSQSPYTVMNRTGEEKEKNKALTTGLTLPVIKVKFRTPLPTGLQHAK